MGLTDRNRLGSVKRRQERLERQLNKQILKRRAPTTKAHSTKSRTSLGVSNRISSRSFSNRKSLAKISACQRNL